MTADAPGRLRAAMTGAQRRVSASGGNRSLSTRRAAARDFGPYDADTRPADVPDEPGLVDFGSVRVVLPDDGDVAVEPTANGRLQAVHVTLPGGRLSISALAAPGAGDLWGELAAEIQASLRDGGARVRSFTGEWGRELHASTGAATSVFIGVDGERWMLYGVATGPSRHAADLDSALRAMLRSCVVVRGNAPYPVRTVLPLTVPDYLLDPEEEDEEGVEEMPAPAPPRVPAPRSAAPLPRRSPEAEHVAEPTRAMSPVRPPAPRPGPPARSAPAPAPPRASSLPTEYLPLRPRPAADASPPAGLPPRPEQGTDRRPRDGRPPSAEPAPWAGAPRASSAGGSTPADRAAAADDPRTEWWPVPAADPPAPAPASGEALSNRAPNGSTPAGPAPSGPVLNGSTLNESVLPTSALTGSGLSGPAPGGPAPDGSGPSGSDLNGSVPNGSDLNGWASNGWESNGSASNGFAPYGSLANGSTPHGSTPNGSGGSGPPPSHAVLSEPARPEVDPDWWATPLHDEILHRERSPEPRPADPGPLPGPSGSRAEPGERPLDPAVRGDSRRPGRDSPRDRAARPHGPRGVDPADEHRRADPADEHRRADPADEHRRADASLDLAALVRARSGRRRARAAEDTPVPPPDAADGPPRRDVDAPDERRADRTRRDEARDGTGRRRAEDGGDRGRAYRPADGGRAGRRRADDVEGAEDAGGRHGSPGHREDAGDADARPGRRSRDRAGAPDRDVDPYDPGRRGVDRYGAAERDPYRTDPYRGARRRVDPYSAGPHRAGPYRRDPYRADPYDAGPSRARPYRPDRYRTDPYDADPYDTGPYDAVPYDADPYGADPYGAVPYGAVPYGADPYGADPYDVERHDAGPYRADPYGADRYRGTDRRRAARPGADPRSAGTRGADPYRDDPYGDDRYTAGRYPAAADRAADDRLPRRGRNGNAAPDEPVTGRRGRAAEQPGRRRRDRRDGDPWDDAPDPGRDADGTGRRRSRPDDGPPARSGRRRAAPDDDAPGRRDEPRGSLYGAPSDSGRHHRPR